MRIKSFTTIFIILLTSFVFGQNPHWETITKSKVGEIENRVKQSAVFPEKLTLVKFKEKNLRSFLSEIPKRNENTQRKNLPTLALPMPDGTTMSFHVEESSIMDPELQSKFPNIKSYAGFGIEDKTAYLRFDYSKKGFHFQVLSATKGVIKIDPISGEKNAYMAYFKKDLIVTEEKQHFECGFDEEIHGTSDKTPSDPSRFLQGDDDLREYQLAVAATGEYTAYHGGTVEDAMSAINTTVTRVVGIYENEFSITMTLIANNDLVVYTDPMTDPFTNGNAGMMINENRDNMNAVIGSSNFDIGHLFGTSGAGLAYLNGPCGSNKARATSAIANPIGDFFDVDYVCHEMGHQFGANHVQYNTCNRNVATAMEPGSGSTIMGYAGICAPNIQSNTDAYFNAISIEEIENFTTNGNGDTCPVITSTGNTTPTVSAGNNHTIPKSTPFSLTATGSDPNGDTLTYCWEQQDNIGTDPQPPVSTNINGPMFRSIAPSTSNERFFPNLVDVVNGNSPEWEVLPSVARTMNFRVTVRDNAPGNGLTAEDDMLVVVDPTSGPFVLTSPNTGTQWNTGETKTITWDVANTNLPPVSCSTVDLLLSIDGGYTYPTVLASNVANNGTYDIVVPYLMSAFARVKVRASNNIFYDISDVNFGINSPPFPEYCIPEYSNGSCSSGDFIDDVSFESINNVDTGCATDGDNYSNYKNLKALVENDNTYSLTVKCNPNYAQYFAGYIDWNLDGDFLDTNEFIDLGYVAKGATSTANVIIASDVTMGEKVMRVICRYGATALTAADGCSTTFNYGETEDYLIEVTDPCVTNITVTENYGNGSMDVVSASYEVSAANIISNGAEVNYVAGSIISLNSGFEVQAGAVFEAFVGPCQ